MNGLLIGLALLATEGVIARQWQAVRAPAAGAAQAVGGTSNGCLQGAGTLPVSGPGYEVARIGRNRRYGHPALIAFIQRLAAGAHRDKLGLVVVGDLSQPRGGPTPSGHRSHQTGLDADIAYAAPAGVRAGHLSRRAREHIKAVTVVDLPTQTLTEAWTSSTAALLALAAADPAVDRIFVNPAIKKTLCEGSATAHAAWQSRLRPWWGHHDHFHVRLACPADSPLCVPQDAPPDDGCGAALAWWFSDAAGAALAKKKQSETEAPEPLLPPACAAVLEAPPLASGP